MVKQWIMSLTFPERRKRELNRYREKIIYFQMMEKDELSLEYINLKSEYEHKKNVILPLLMISLLFILANAWEIYIRFNMKIFIEQSIQQPDEIKVLEVIFWILFLFITSFIGGITYCVSKRKREIFKSILMIEVVQFEQKT